MIKFFTLIFCLLFTHNLYAQHVAWAYNVGLPHNHFISAIATQPNGNHIVSINDRKATMNSTGLYMGDLIFQKKDSSGNQIWQKHFPAIAIVMSLKIDDQKNIYIAGAYRNTLNLGSYSFTAASLGHNWFVAKLDSTGNVTWATADQQSTGTTYAAYVTVGNNQDFYLVYQKDFLGFITKYNASGVAQWTKSAPGVRTFSSIVVDSNNDLYVTGNCEGNANIDGFTPGIPTSSAYVAFLAKLNAQQQQTEWIDFQLYNTFDTKDALIMNNNQLYWLHKKRNTLTSPLYHTLQKFTKAGSLLAEADTIPNLSVSLHMSNRFVITSKKEMVISLANFDTARIIVLDSALQFQHQYKFVSKSIGAPFLSSFNQKIISGGHFSGATATINSNSVLNANTPLTQNDNFLSAFSLHPLQNPVTGITSLAENHIIIFPVPATNFIYVSSPASQINIYSLEGKLLSTSKNTNRISVANLANGTYVVEFVNRGKSIRRKFVKQ